MRVEEQVKAYMDAQTAQKGNDMYALHQLILKLKPESKLWFLDGKDAMGKTVSNPNIGYGFQTIHYADCKTREFYQIGLSANTTGISIYIMGIENKNYLAETYGKVIGKASVTSYCIKFKTVKDINLDILKAAILDGFEAQS